MTVLTTEQRKQLEKTCVAGRRAAETSVRAALATLGVAADKVPSHLGEADRFLRRSLRAKQRQLGHDPELLIAECAYEQWHRLLFARFLAENNLLIHPAYGAPVTIDECEELAAELGEPDGWAVAGSFATQILPGIFRLDDPCIQVRLAPEGRVELERLVSSVPRESFLADDSLGWVYQFWQKDKKDEVNKSERKIGGADLGPVTQLFTENYMVRFLLENSLGAWWAARHPDSPLVKDWRYLRFDDDGLPAAGAFEQWPESIADVTVMDPCCGSGHFLVEAFQMLWQMRIEEEGLGPVAAQDAVLQDNLFGLELDPRCVQIAMFAVALQAWKVGGGWREIPTPNIACSGIPVKAPVEEWKALANGDARLENALVRLHILFREADTLGSLIDPKRLVEITDATGLQASFEDVEWDDVYPLLDEALSDETDDPATAVLGFDAAGIARAADFLSRQYTLLATNVPFLGIGKMNDLLSGVCQSRSPNGARNLGTVLLDSFDARRAVSTAIVLPADFLSLPWFEGLRRQLLAQRQIDGIVRLGPQAFSTPMFDYLTCLLLSSNHRASHDHEFFEVDMDSIHWPELAERLPGHPLLRSPQFAHRNNPASRIEKAGSEPAAGRLQEYVDINAGAKPGQTAMVTRRFWETPQLMPGWQRMSSSPAGVADYEGKSSVIMTPDAMRAVGVTGFDTVGGASRGRRGVIIAKMGHLNACLYDGSWSDDNTYTLIPRSLDDLGALYAFARSSDFYASVRNVSAKTAVPVSAVGAARVDFAHWRRTAEDLYPEDLPEPWSDDPTQWLFEGRPEVGTESLQVAMGRLLGHCWPEQAEPDDLDVLADEDGVVCMPPVLGERAAADRLQELLARAFGSTWSPARTRELLEASGSKKTDMETWLRDDFFKAHCKVFKNRPFIWHIWDGRRDGFAALVNYHKFDRATLERLTYSYLGDWIERQTAGVSDEVAGAEERLAAAQDLQQRLEQILEGEPPYDIYVRWKSLEEQPIGWEPDLNDGVRLNVRPFVEAGVLRNKFTVHWKKDRGKNPDGGERFNDLHFTLAEKQAAREGEGS